MTDEQMKAEGEYELARKRLSSAKGKGGSGAEANYNQAYQRLVSLGLRPKLRGKYNV